MSHYGFYKSISFVMIKIMSKAIFKGEERRGDTLKKGEEASRKENRANGGKGVTNNVG